MSSAIRPHRSPSNPKSGHHDGRADRPARHQPAPAVLGRIDRRRHPRRAMTERVTVLRRSHDVQAYRQPICSIQLRDFSEGGLAATCQTPLQPNEPVAVCFPPHGTDPGLDRFGHVLRCEADEFGYRVAIAFDRRTAA